MSVVNKEWLNGMQNKRRKCVSDLKVGVQYKVLGLFVVKSKYSTQTPVAEVKLDDEPSFQVYLPSRFQFTREDLAKGFDENLKLVSNGRKDQTSSYDIKFM